MEGEGLGEGYWHVGEHTRPTSYVGVDESGQYSGGGNH